MHTHHDECTQVWESGTVVNCRRQLLTSAGRPTDSAKRLDYTGYTDAHLAACPRPAGESVWMCRPCWLKFEKWANDDALQRWNVDAVNVKVRREQMKHAILQETARVTLLVKKTTLQTTILKEAHDARIVRHLASRQRHCNRNDSSNRGVCFSKTVLSAGSWTRDAILNQLLFEISREVCSVLSPPHRHVHPHT